MTLDDCTDMLAQLAIAMQKQMDVPTYAAYHAMLKDVPVELAVFGLELWQQTGPRFFPTAPEIRCFAEKARRQQLALHPWSACVDCEDHPRWRSVLIDGVPRMEKCPCVLRHHESLVRKGLGVALAALPGEDVAQAEVVYPTLDQLPGDVRLRLGAIAGQKVLR